MAAVKRSRKGDILRKGQQPKSPKAVAKRGKLPSRPKRNVCTIRFPRSSYLTACPLVSWYFNRHMRNDLLSLQKGKHLLGPCMDVPHTKMPLQQHSSHRCPDFLRAALRQLASKKRAKWVVASTKRRRYSDDEIFYRLAKPSELEDEGDGGSTSNAGSEDGTPHAPGIPQPTVNEMQEVLS